MIYFDKTAKPRNPFAKELAERKYRNRIVKSKKNKTLNKRAEKEIKEFMHNY